MKTPKAAYAFLLLLVACSVHPSAPADRSPARPADPQSSYEPKSAPGAGQALLARMAGDWEVEKTFYPREGGVPAKARGTCQQRMIHGGRFLQSDFTFENSDGASTGTGVIGFDPQTGRFTSFWVDSRSTRTSIRQSEGVFAGEEIVLFSKTLGEDGAARRSRTSSRLSKDGQHLDHRQWSVGENEIGRAHV